MPTLELPAQFVVSMIVIGVIVHVMLAGTAYLIFLERKVAAWTQDRIGPNRVNFSFGQDNLWRKLHMDFMNSFHFFGLGQALADGIKLLIKEEYNPPNADKRLFLLAPALVVIPALIGWAVIPWGGWFAFPGLELGPILIPAAVVRITALPIDIGAIYILAIGSLAVYGVVLASYASNNKYSFLGGLRATAQMLSYEIPMGLCVLMMILTYQTADLGLMADLQSTTGFSLGWSAWEPTGFEGDVWGIFMHPLLAVIFFICVLAECNRAPFDLAEAEQELVGGFHTEYSSMKWALFFLGEYMHMITGSAFFAVMFLGGWDLLPFVQVFPTVAGVDNWMLGVLLVLLKFGIFAGKITFLLFVMMWIRWTLPRFRFDQLMKLAWRGLIPITLVMLLVTGLIVYLNPTPGLRPWLMLGANAAVAIGAALVGPLLPQGPAVNRRIGLRGSRFSPLGTSA